MHDAYLPYAAEIVGRTQESPTIFTLQLRFNDAEQHKRYRFKPGQFNMLYLFGVGEVAISIVSDPEMQGELTHTIRAIGRVTNALAQLNVGETIGIRGPYGRGWPLELAINKEIIIVTGGLGCAPVMGMINYIIKRLSQYKSLKILQGIKHSSDFIFAQRYKEWYLLPKTEIHISADQADSTWPFQTGRVTDMIDSLSCNPEDTLVMICGPEIMMETAAKAFLKKQISEECIYLSMERNMECAIGQCGHCQYGGLFICKDGPVLNYAQIKDLLTVNGF
ncbi:MAG TPA: FAD/NAD(P)-binding protein [Gammaproteobacteria bacterium]|nr:FAD/NAD(P)-binding protein [Gammaproteobacteria bacterium]